LRRVNGNVHLLLAKIAEREKDLGAALDHYRKAHGAFLAEHNWYYHLHVLCGYARVARLQRNYSQARWYLDLTQQAVSGPGFKSMQEEIRLERERMEQDEVDLVIDGRKGMIRTRQGGKISLRKQYV